MSHTDNLTPEEEKVLRAYFHALLDSGKVKFPSLCFNPYEDYAEQSHRKERFNRVLNRWKVKHNHNLP